MLAFIGCAWSRMLCATAARLRTVVCVPFFPFFFSYLVMSAFDRHPLRVLPHSYTYVHPASNAYPMGYFLSAERDSDLWYHESIHLPRMPLERTAYSVSRRLFFSAACFIRAHVT